MKMSESAPLFISLDIPSGDRQKAFYAYLNSEWRKRSAKSSGTFGSVAEDGFEVEVSVNFKAQFGGLTLKFQFLTAANRILEGVKVSLIEIPDTTLSWREFAYEFISSALTAALSKRMSSFFRRRSLYYLGPELDGEYWFGKVRFAPAESIPSEFPTARCERAAFLDFTVDAIDQFHSISLADQIERSFAARLSLLLDVDLYQHSHHHVWVQLPDDGGNALCQRGYDEGRPLQSMPRKGEICSAGATAPIARIIFATEKLKIPLEARRFLRAVEQCENPKRQYIDGAARLYQIGLSLQMRFPSAALAYSIAAIDALSKTIPAYTVNDFLRRFSPLSLACPEVTEKLWNDFRCAHFHAGDFRLGEFDGAALMDVIIDVDAANQMHMKRRSQKIIRQAIVNWIVALVSDNIIDSSHKVT